MAARLVVLVGRQGVRRFRGAMWRGPYTSLALLIINHGLSHSQALKDLVVYGTIRTCCIPINSRGHRCYRPGVFPRRPSASMMSLVPQSEYGCLSHDALLTFTTRNRGWRPAMVNLINVNQAFTHIYFSSPASLAYSPIVARRSQGFKFTAVDNCGMECAIVPATGGGEGEGGLFAFFFLWRWI
ncbi:hypothetical protein BC827DRAFT_177353 [Russula dissimulans]|nr:hypothetical protein BC827DRAFT_177353 [Russula dissimulans]